MFLHKVENDYFDVLTKKYIHPEQLTEKSRYSLSGDSVYVLDTIRNKINEKEMYVVLTITTSCNLACAYCFENGTIRHAINEKTLSEVIHNIEKYIIENGIKKLHCTLFGGEPLLEEQLVAKFTTVLHEFCKDNEILLTISMTTNGLIANKSLLEKLYQNSLTCVQVTFDGPKEMNNRRRRSRNISVKDPYTTILKNLNTFLSIFDTVNIKYNFDKQNLDEFDIFLNDLSEVVQSQYIGKIVILVEAIQGTHNSHYSYNYRNTDEELAKAYITIISKLVDANIKYRSKIFNTPCMATAPNSFLIDPDGNCSCCISNFQKNELFIGNFSQVTRSRSLSTRTELNRLDLLRSHCRNCDFLAGCWGGCLYELSVNGKECTKNVNCRKNFFEKAVDLFYHEIYLKKGVDKID